MDDCGSKRGVATRKNRRPRSSDAPRVPRSPRAIVRERMPMRGHGGMGFNTRRPRARPGSSRSSPTHPTRSNGHEAAYIRRRAAAPGSEGADQERPGPAVTRGESRRADGRVRPCTGRIVRGQLLHRPLVAAKRDPCFRPGGGRRPSEGRDGRTVARKERGDPSSSPRGGGLLTRKAWRLVPWRAGSHPRLLRPRVPGPTPPRRLPSSAGVPGGPRVPWPRNRAG